MSEEPQGAPANPHSAEMPEPNSPRRPRRRWARRVAFAALAPLLAAGALIAYSRGPEGRAWMASVTGESGWWEGVKGTGALALLSITSPPLELADEAPVEHKSASPFGANTFFQLEADPEQVRRGFARMRDGGIGWARQQFPWEDIEIHARGDFQDRRNDPPRSAWDKYDNIVKEAYNHGVKLLVRLDDPPEWSYADPAAAGAQKGPPDDVADYANFVAAVVSRYCGQVRYYQLWNEPNIYPEWGGNDASPADVDPAGYAALLKAARAAARAACDDVVVVSAALAPNTEPGGRNMDDLAYLEALYEAGWREDFDILAVQGFGLWTGPGDRRASRDRTNFSRPLLARDIMVRGGDAAKTVWITEFGWDSPPPEMEAPYGRVDEETRAAYTRQAYERMLAEWPWAGVGFAWFLRRPDMEWHARPEGYFRLLEPDWTALPSFRAIQEMALEPPLIHRGRHRPDQHSLIYTGPWLAEPPEGEARLRIGLTGAELQLSFWGDGFEVILADEAALADVRLPAAPGALVEVAEGPTPSAAPVTATAPDAGEALAVYGVVDGDDGALAIEPEDGRRVIRRTGLDLGEHMVILQVQSGAMPFEELRILAPAPAHPLAGALRVAALAVGLLIGLPLLALLARRRTTDPTQSTPTEGGAPADEA